MIKENLIALQELAARTLEDILDTGSNKDKIEAVKIILAYTLEKPTAKGENGSANSEANEHLNEILKRNKAKLPSGVSIALNKNKTN